MLIAGWLSWQLFSAAEMYIGGLMPSSWSLEYAATLAVLAILVPLVCMRGFLVCLIVAVLTAWIGQLLPLRLGLVAAVFAGMVAGVVAEQLAGSRKGVQ